MALFLLVARSFMHKVLTDLEALGGDVSPVAKSEKHLECSNRLMTPRFAQRVRNIIDVNPGTSMTAITTYTQVFVDTIDPQRGV